MKAELPFDTYCILRGFVGLGIFMKLDVKMGLKMEENRESKLLSGQLPRQGLFSLRFECFQDDFVRGHVDSRCLFPLIKINVF